MIKHLLTLVAAASFIAGCAHEDQAPNPVAPLPAQSFKRDWAADLKLENDTVTKVFVKEDVVIAYTKKHTAFVINKSSGFIRFLTQIGDSPLPPRDPVVLKDRIIFPTNSTLEIYKRDGRFERSYTTQSSLRTNAVGASNGSRIFFGVDTPGAGRMVAVETLPGEYKPVNQKWELMSDKGAPIDGAPAVHQGVVYVAFSDGNVYAVNADNRAPIWATSTGLTFKTYGPVQADVKADDFGVYVPSTDSKFYCLDKTQGKVKWSYFAGSSLRETPWITATMVYLPVRNRGIVAIDKINGPSVREPKWVIKDMVKLVAEDEKLAYFQRNDNIVVAVDKASGEQRFTSKRTDLTTFATNTRDGTIYAATRDGAILAITPVLKPGFTGEIALDLGESRPVATLVAN